MSNDMQNKTGHSHRPLREILSRVGMELQDIAILIEYLETLHESEKIETYIDAMEHKKQLQSIDLMLQKVRSLADFVETISQDVDAGIIIDLTTALNHITLSDLKKRLSSENQFTASADMYKYHSGELDFF